MKLASLKLGSAFPCPHIDPRPRLPLSSCVFHPCSEFFHMRTTLSRGHGLLFIPRAAHPCHREVHALPCPALSLLSMAVC